MKTALTITGNDSSGGADIQADIKTMTAHGVYAMSAITVLTAQSTTDVTGIMEVTPFLLEEQLDDVFTDILPGAVKIGMVSSGDLVEAIGSRLAFYRAVNAMMDLAMISTSGSRLISNEAIGALKKALLPMADLLTSNIPEVGVLSGVEIHNPDDMETAVRVIGEGYGYAVLLKGDHRLNDANDLLYRNKKLKWFKDERTDNPNTHGTGCTLFSAVASNLIKDMDMDLVMGQAKVYLSGALEAQLGPGKGSGPMNHGFAIQSGH